MAKVLMGMLGLCIIVIVMSQAIPLMASMSIVGASQSTILVSTGDAITEGIPILGMVCVICMIGLLWDSRR